MPLLRYRTGDQAVASGERCPCGRAFPVVERILGREDDVIVTPEGRLIGRLDPIFKVVKTLHETRIVQDRRNHVRVEVVSGTRVPADELAALERELRHRLGPCMEIDFVHVPAIPRTASGKLRQVVNLVDHRTTATEAALALQGTRVNGAGDENQ